MANSDRIVLPPIDCDGDITISSNKCIQVGDIKAKGSVEISSIADGTPQHILDFINGRKKARPESKPTMTNTVPTNSGDEKGEESIKIGESALSKRVQLIPFTVETVVNERT